jgi:uncharacterized protein YbaR (Trm112 family)
MNKLITTGQSVVVAIVVAVNFLVAPRDSTLTVAIPTFEVQSIIENRLWTEHPVQILYTFMNRGARFQGVGDDINGLTFANRLVLRYGADSVDRHNPPFDLRDVLRAEDKEALEEFVLKASYRSVLACPHDKNQACNFAIGWNRERTRERDIQMLVIRVSENLYLITDDSIIRLK